MTATAASGHFEPGFALVVFSGQADLKWLRILKPGFRHCFVVIENRDRWILYNPLSHRTEIAVLEGVTGMELMKCYRGQGFRVVPWLLCPVCKKSAPWGLYTCVEAIKRILGIHAHWIITPWNLYKFLKNYK
ncbi:MAG: hypothetical protein IH994_01525 [Proteobacteria bacterium]|nr:hypothetical protein [Pseudomonadota bacterium]